MFPRDRDTFAKREEGGKKHPDMAPPKPNTSYHTHGTSKYKSRGGGLKERYTTKFPAEFLRHQKGDKLKRIARGRRRVGKTEEKAPIPQTTPHKPQNSPPSTMSPGTKEWEYTRAITTHSPKDQPYQPNTIKNKATKQQTRKTTYPLQTPIRERPTSPDLSRSPPSDTPPIQKSGVKAYPPCSGGILTILSCPFSGERGMRLECVRLVYREFVPLRPSLTPATSRPFWGSGGA